MSRDRTCDRLWALGDKACELLRLVHEAHEWAWDSTGRGSEGPRVAVGGVSDPTVAAVLAADRRRVRGALRYVARRVRAAHRELELARARLEDAWGT